LIRAQKVKRRSLLKALAAASISPVYARAARAESADTMTPDHPTTPAENAPPADAVERIAGFVELVREHWRVPGVAVAVIHRGRPFMAAGFGVKNLTRPDPIDAHTAFNIGSCSKAYTACAAAILVDEGRIGWDDQVKPLMPELELYDPDVTRRVTLRDLLSHRVGLSRACIAEGDSDLSRAEVLARAADAPKKAEFRQKFCYSNLGYIIAAELIGRVAQQPFEHFVEARVLRPLGMDDSTAEAKGWLALGNVADPHGYWDYRQRPVPPLDHGNLMGAGFLYTSANDALAWLQLQLGRSRIVSERSLREMHTAQVTDPETYGLGWGVGLANGRNYLGHSGETRGFASRARIEPARDYASFVATNSQGHAAEAISGMINQTLNALPARDELDFYDTGWARRVSEAAARAEADRKSDPLDSTSAPSLAAFAGTYRNRGFGTLSVREAGGALRLAIKDMPIYDGWLVRYAGESFAYQMDGFRATKERRPVRSLDPRIYFHEKEGTIAGLEARDMLFGPTTFQRV